MRRVVYEIGVKRLFDIIWVHVVVSMHLGHNETSLHQTQEKNSNTSNKSNKNKVAAWCLVK